MMLLTSDKKNNIFQRSLDKVAILFTFTPSLTPWRRVLLEKLTVTELVKKTPLPPFMEPEGSLQCSEEHATGPCPEPDESSPHLPTLFP